MLFYIFILKLYSLFVNNIFKSNNFIELLFSCSNVKCKLGCILLRKLPNNFICLVLPLCKTMMSSTYLVQYTMLFTYFFEPEGICVCLFEPKYISASMGRGDPIVRLALEFE